MDSLNRAKFLELAADSVAADSLYLVPEDGGGSRLEMGQYKERQSHLSLLGKMWFMSDKVKQFQVRSPYIAWVLYKILHHLFKGCTKIRIQNGSICLQHKLFLRGFYYKNRKLYAQHK